MSGRRGAEGWLGGRAVSVRRRRRRVLYLEVLSAVHLLAEGEVGDALEDVLLRARRLDVLHQLERLLHLVVVHVVDHQVEPRLGHHPHQRRQQLERVAEGMWGQSNCARIAQNCDGIAPNCALACSARSPFEKTTMLWRTRGDCTFSGDGASFVSGESSASAALPSYSLNWLHAFRLSATAESGFACRYAASARRQRIAQQNCTGLRRIARQLRACRYAARISRLTS